MSELESLCHALEDSVRSLPSFVNTFEQRATRLRTLAAQLEQAARLVQNGPSVSHAVDRLYEAASAMTTSSQTLTTAVQQSRNFVSRTIGGTGGHPVNVASMPGSGGSQDPSAVESASSRSASSSLAEFWLNHQGEYAPATDAEWGAMPESVPPCATLSTFVPYVNDGGDENPGRGVNCADCARAVEASWRGNPQVSAARAPGLDGEDFSRIEEWLSAPLTQSSFEDIGEHLGQQGSGASAYVVVAWKGGSGHAFNAVNRDGTVYFVDAQPTGGAIDVWPPKRTSPGYGYDESDVAQTYVHFIQNEVR